MHEKEFNTIVVNSIKATGGAAWKIPDNAGQGISTSKQPCDLFGVIQRGDICRNIFCESKYNKDFSAWNTNRIEDHQAEWLSQFARVPDAEVYITLGLHAARGDLRAYVFDWRWLKPLYEAGKSFWAKELETFPYNKVSKGIFEFTNIIGASNV